VALLLACPPALAKGKPAAAPSPAGARDKEAREREARKACLDGDYAKGVALLSDLFLDFKDPNYFFNQGRCYEQNERFEEAISRFREYLRTGTEDRGLAEKHIAECEALLQKKSPPVIEPVAPPPAPVFVPVPVEPVGVVRQPQAPSTSPGSGLRIAGVVVAAVGAAALIAGVVLNLQANSLADSIIPPHSFNRNTESTRKSCETFSVLSYAVGAAGMATGVILYGIGWGKARGARGVALLPNVGPGFAGATAGGSF
jgi:hypothetical protein